MTNPPMESLITYTECPRKRSLASYLQTKTLKEKIDHTYFGIRLKTNTRRDRDGPAGRNRRERKNQLGDVPTVPSLCDKVIQIAVRHDQADVAKEALDLMSRHASVIAGVISEDTLESLLARCCRDGDARAAMACVLYAHKCAMPGAMSLGKSARNAKILSLVDMQKLDQLFENDASWEERISM